MTQQVLAKENFRTT